MYEANPKTTNLAGNPKITDTTPRREGSYDESTPFEKFEDLTTKLIRVPKKEADEQARKRK